MEQVGQEVRRQVEGALSRYDLSTAISKIWDLINRANKYIDEQAPWDLNRQGNRGRLSRVLYDVAEAARYSAVLLTPFLVETPERIYRQLGFDGDPRAAWASGLVWGSLPAGCRVRRGEPLFPRIDLDEWFAKQELEGRQQEATDGQAADVDPAKIAGTEGVVLLDFSEFAKLDLRVASIMSAEPVKGADRLLLLRVSLGSEERQIVAGIAQHYSPEELPGRQVVLVANLKPAVIRKVRSEGMLLAAQHEGRLVLIGPEQPIAPGSPVR